MPEQMINILITGARQLNISLSEDQAKILIAYKNVLLKKNAEINLTAVTNDREFIIKHLLDSLTVAVLPELSGLIADVGTGGGFPGAVIAVYRPDCAVTMIDSTEKKIRATSELCKECGINARFLFGRAEELGRTVEYREQFDTVVARAVSALPKLLEYCLPLVAKGGHFIAMKGPEADAELMQSKRAIVELGGVVKEVRTVVLPNKAKRNLVIINKERATSNDYPRHNKRIQSFPLG